MPLHGIARSWVQPIRQRPTRARFARTLPPVSKKTSATAPMPRKPPPSRLPISLATTASARGPVRRANVTTAATKTNLLGLSQGDLEQFLAARGEKAFRARQIMQWIYQRDVDTFDEMTDLSKALRAKLCEDAEIVSPKVRSRHDAADGCVKWLF